MTRAEFEASLSALDLSSPEFARLTSTDPATVRGWGKERTVGAKVIDGRQTMQRRLQAIPGWVQPLLEAWARSPASMRAWIRTMDQQQSP